MLTAHEAHESLGGHGVELAWFTDPLTSVLLAIVAFLYLLGWRRARAARRVPAWEELALFGGGWLMVGIALVSPVHTAGEAVLSAHMLQHTLLILGPAAMLAGSGGTRLVQGVPAALRGHLMRGLRALGVPRLPLGATTSLMVVTISAWHAPPIFEAAARIPLLHAIEHVSLLAVSAIYWSRVIGPGRSKAPTGAALASLLALAVFGAGIGALLSFASAPWYPFVADQAVRAGVDWALDQQLAGVAMTLPMGVTMMAVAARLAWRWSGAAGWSPSNIRLAPGQAETKTSAATNPNSKAR